MTEEPDLTQDVADPTRAREWSEPWMGPFLDVMSRLPTISRAATSVSVSRRTVQRWMQKDEDFALAVEDARQEALDALEAQLYVRGSVGVPVEKTVTRTLSDGSVETTVTTERHISDSVAMFYLRRWRPEYRESFRVEQTGANGGPIQVQVVEEDAARFDARLADLEARQAAIAVDG